MARSVMIATTTNSALRSREGSQERAEGWLEKALYAPGDYGLDGLRIEPAKSTFIPTEALNLISPFISRKNGNLDKRRIRDLFDWVIDDPVLMDKAIQYSKSYSAHDPERVHIALRAEQAQRLDKFFAKEHQVYENYLLQGVSTRLLENSWPSIFRGVLMAGAWAVKEGRKPLENRRPFTLSSRSKWILELIESQLGVEGDAAFRKIAEVESSRVDSSIPTSVKRTIRVSPEIAARLDFEAAITSRYINSVMRQLIERGRPLRPITARPAVASASVEEEVDVQFNADPNLVKQFDEFARRSGSSFRELLERELDAQLAFSSAVAIPKVKVGEPVTRTRGTNERINFLAHPEIMAEWGKVWGQGSAVIVKGVAVLKDADSKVVRDLMALYQPKRGDPRHHGSVDTPTSLALTELAEKYETTKFHMGTVAIAAGLGLHQSQNQQQTNSTDIGR